MDRYIGHPNSYTTSSISFSLVTKVNLRLYQQSLYGHYYLRVLAKYPSADWFTDVMGFANYPFEQYYQEVEIPVNVKSLPRSDTLYHFKVQLCRRKNAEVDVQCNDYSHLDYFVARSKFTLFIS